MKTLYLFLLAALASLLAQAQPTLTATNSNPVIGEHYRSTYCHTTGIAIGTGGAGATWDYSGITDSIPDSVAIIPCSATGYCDSFTSGTNSFVMATISLGIYWSFFADASELGFGDAHYSDTAGGGPGGADYSYGIKPYKMLKYPLAYGGNWHDTAYYIVPSNHQHTFVSQYHSADGYGTLVTPAGTYANVLRTHTISYYTDTQFNSTPPSIQHSRFDDYFWYQPGTHHPLLRIDVLSDSATGALLQVDNVVYSPGNATTGVSMDAEASANISVYPNPAKDNLYIKWDAAITGNCDIVLSDVTGKTVVTAHTNTGAEITIPVGGLATGMYILKMNNANGVFTKRVAIQRE